MLHRIVNSLRRLWKWQTEPYGNDVSEGEAISPSGPLPPVLVKYRTH